MKTILCIVLACTFSSAIAREPTRGYNSNASEMSALGGISVVYGSMLLVAGSANAVVESVETVGESAVVVLKGAGEASRVTLKMSGKVVAGASIAAGTAVNVVTMASGYALVVAGSVIGFVPNEAGKALLHHSRAGS